METTDYCFSFFRKPIQNIEPIRAVGIVDVYRYIIGHYAQPQTENLRLMQSSPEAKRYKATHFDYCTFSGLFRKRNEKSASSPFFPYHIHGMDCVNTKNNSFFLS